jgi:hypothetical protein
LVTDVSGDLACPEASVTNYHHTPRNNPEELRSQTVAQSLYREVRCDGATNRAASDDVLPEHVVDADNAVWPGGTAVVHDCCVALHPHPAAIFREEPEVLCRHLALEQNCKRSTLSIETLINGRTLNFALGGGADRVAVYTVCLVLKTMLRKSC